MTLVEVEESELAHLKVRASHQAAIEQKNQEVRKLKQRYDMAKDASLAAKKNYDEGVAELSELINEGPSAQLSLPFNDAKESTKADAPKVHWRDRPIQELNLAKGMLDKCLELGINTVGKLKDVEDGKVPGYEEKRLAGIEGWGKGKVERAKAALGVLCGNESDFEESPISEAEQPAEETAMIANQTEDGESIMIEVLVDVPNGESIGLVKGAKVPAIRRGPNAQVAIEESSPYLFMSGEYVIVTVAEPMIAENEAGFLTDAPEPPVESEQETEASEA
jgi:hypothetical protein